MSRAHSFRACDPPAISGSLGSAFRTSTLDAAPTPDPLTPDLESISLATSHAPHTSAMDPHPLVNRLPAIENRCSQGTRPASNIAQRLEFVRPNRRRPRRHTTVTGQNPSFPRVQLGDEPTTTGDFDVRDVALRIDAAL
jgi:hypothetical protein